jgi:MFS family permease
MLTQKQQFRFVLALPIINVIADSTQGYFSQGIASPGYLRAIVILLFVFFHFKYFFQKKRINHAIILSLFYYLILGFLSSNISYSISIYLKYFIASIMFPIGYYYFNSFERFYKLMKVMVWTLGIYVAMLVISNAFGLGSSDYLEDSVYFGAGRVNSTKAMMILTLIYPLVYRFEPSMRNRRIYLLILIGGLIFIFLGIKRSALLGLFVGYAIYFLLTPYRTRLIKTLLGLSLILIISSPLYFDLVMERFEVRQEAGRFDIAQAKEEEARVIELYKVIDAFEEGNIFYKLFGAELFNSRDYFMTNRMLHTDYAIMLQGSGVVGFFLFMYIYYLIFIKILFINRKLKKHAHIKDILAVNVSILIAVLIAGIAGTVLTTGLRSIAFLFWGASFSYTNNEYWKLRMRDNA